MERKQLVVLARGLRARATSAEKVLWAHLRGRRLAGIKFRRQHPIGCYIADFFAPEARLVIELDGPIHAHRARRDADRTREIEVGDVRLLRFTNHDVLHRLPYVLSMIVRFLSFRTP